MKIKLALVALSFVSITTYAQNVGVNTTTPEAALDINGDIIIRPADLSVPDGISLAMDVNTTKFSYYRITGPTADFTIAGITAGIDGRLLTLFNRSGFAMQLNNEDATAAVGDRIVTGTGADMIIPNKGVVNLQYDATEQQWIVKSSSKGGGNVIGGYWDTDGTHIYNNNTGSIGMGTSTPLSTSRLTIQTALNNGGWTHIGGTNSIIVSESIGGVSASLGTSTNHAFRLNANGLGRLQLYPDGKVVVGSNAFAPASQGRLTIESELGYGLTHTDGNISVGTYVGGFPETGWFGTISNHPVSFFANNGGALMTILQNGNAGIGTNAPSAKLHVAGNQKIDGANFIEFGAGVAGKEVNAGKIGYQTFTTGALDIVGAGTGTGNRKIRFWNEGGAIFSGNVGIGTLNPAHPLSVNGTIQSKEVIVETGWADYVFEKNYKLPLLGEVEKFIKQNKHLPNIPSANEIEKEGLHVGEIQKRMMEKIEELTLYLIEANKQIENLKKEIDDVKKTVCDTPNK